MINVLTDETGPINSRTISTVAQMASRPLPCCKHMAGSKWEIFGIANEMEWPNDPDEPISNIGRFCLLENIEEANPTMLLMRRGQMELAIWAPKTYRGHCMPPKDDMLADYNQNIIRSCLKLNVVVIIS